MTAVTVGKATREIRVTDSRGQEVVGHLSEPGVDGHAVGGFTIDFGDYPDGSVPESETGLRDNFLDDPDNEDEMGISDGRLAVVEFRGPDQAFSGLGQGGGRRGYLWRNTGTLTDDVSGTFEVPITGGDIGSGGYGWGGPLLHIQNDFEGSEYVGVSAWFVAPPFSWTELGVVGRLQEDFSYLDIHLGTSLPEEGDEIYLRSVNGQVALEVNGETVCGPCDIPAGLVGSAIHGVQIDVAEDDEANEGKMAGLTIGTDATALGTRAAPATPSIGSPVETASATTLDVPYPGSISAGDRLLCIMATKNGGTFSASGWSNVSTQFGVTSGIQIGALWKEATGSESGSLTVTKSAAGVMAGVMLRVTGSDLIYMAGQGNASSTSVTAPATQIFTPWATFLWVAAIDTDQSITDPGADWFPLSTGLAANQAIRLVVSVAVASAHGDFPDPPIFNAYENDHFPAQVGSVGVAGTSAAGTIILQAENGS